MCDKGMTAADPVVRISSEHETAAYRGLLLLHQSSQSQCVFARNHPGASSTPKASLMRSIASSEGKSTWSIP